jgi:glycosyltransferase involved in cell wall biosynthesis
MVNAICDDVLVSVGMPVFNGEKTLEAAIESVLNQTFSDFELIISDNASTDRTADICLNYAKLDGRIRYIRQPYNLGAERNFNLVLSEAKSDYFMWATSDDVKSVNFLEINYKFLVNNPLYVASTCPTRFEGDAFDAKRTGCFSLEGDMPDRFIDFLDNWHANARFCSLMRTAVLKQANYLDKIFFGSDWAVMLSIISAGKTNLSSDGFVILGKHGISNSGKIYKYYRKKLIHFVMPFYELNIVVFKMSKSFLMKDKMMIYQCLLKLNYQAIKDLIRNEYIKLFNGK